MTHWYTKDGQTAYGASLKEARENGYLPSITTICKVVANEGLEQWKVRQGILAALTMPKHDGESDSDYINRILDDSRQQARKAAKLGNIIHKLAERYIKGKPLFYHGLRNDVWILFEPLKQVLDRLIKKPIYAEAVLIGDGYAGKADYCEDYLIADYKTTFITLDDVKKDGKIKKHKIYDSWGMQLAALQATSGIKRDCVSVIISTNANYPGVWAYTWSQEELDKAWLQFNAALTIYRSQKGL